MADGHGKRSLATFSPRVIVHMRPRSLAMDRASEIERTGDVCGWEAFESGGQAEYVDSVSSEDSLLDVPAEYRCWTERDLLEEIAELKAEIMRLQNMPPSG